MCGGFGEPANHEEHEWTEKHEMSTVKLKIAQIVRDFRAFRGQTLPRPAADDSATALLTAIPPSLYNARIACPSGMN